MWERIKQLLAPPIFEGEEEKTRIAGLIHTIAMSALVIAILFLTLLPIFAPERNQRLYIIGIAVLLLGGIVFIVRRGWVRIASYSLTASLWLIFTITAIT